VPCDRRPLRTGAVVGLAPRPLRAGAIRSSTLLPLSFGQIVSPFSPPANESKELKTVAIPSELSDRVILLVKQGELFEGTSLELAPSICHAQGVLVGKVGKLHMQGHIVT
jgi:hypothetical protein